MGTFLSTRLKESLLEHTARGVHRTRLQCRTAHDPLGARHDPSLSPQLTELLLLVRDFANLKSAKTWY